MTLNINIIKGPPGSRKTLTLLDRALEASGRYIFAFPRNALIDEQAAYLRERAGAEGVSLAIVAIHSDQPINGSIVDRVEEALAAHAESGHAIILVSHIALTELDSAPLDGWHACIDEIVDTAVASGSFKASLQRTLLEQSYDLEPFVPRKSWRVLVKEGAEAIAPKDAANDAAAKLVEFHRYAVSSRRDLLVNVRDWSSAKKGRSIQWWSVWNPSGLRGCASVTIAAANFFGSLLHQAWKVLLEDEITYQTEDLGAGITRACPDVRVHYFTHHAGSTEWWETHEGSTCVFLIRERLKSIGWTGYYSCNENIWSYFRHDLEGTHCSPKQAGTNSLIEQTSCLYIYSNKAQDGDTAILKALGLERSAIRKTRELEDVRQFVMRGALRRPDFSGRYDMYVYDRAQAEDLEQYLGQHDIGDVQIVPVPEAGIMDVERPDARNNRGEPLTAEEVKRRDRERKQKRRAAENETKEANGTKRGPGRPKGSRNKPKSCGTSDQGTFHAELSAMEDADTVTRAPEEAPELWTEWTQMPGLMSEVALASAPPLA